MTKEAETPPIPAQEENSEGTMTSQSTAAENADSASSANTVSNDQDTDSDIEDNGIVEEDGIMFNYKTKDFNDFEGLWKALHAKEHIIRNMNLELRDVFEAVKESQLSVQGHAYCNVSAFFHGGAGKVTWIGACLRKSKYNVG